MEKLSTIIDFQEARDFGSKMNATYFFLRQNFKGLAKSLLFFTAPFVLLSMAFYHEILIRMMKLSGNHDNIGSPFGLDEYYSSTNFYIQLIASLFFMLIGGVFTVATTYGYFLEYEEKKTIDIDLGNVWRRARKMFWPLLGTMFLYCIGLVIGGGILILPLGALIYVISFINPVLGALSVFVYYIFVIALCIYFSMVFFIRCKERIGFFDALAKLFRITRGQFWNTVFIGGINLYVQTIFSLLFIIPWYIYLYSSYLHNTTKTFFAQASFLDETISAALLMVYGLASVLLSALPLIAIAFQYYHLVELREAKGLMTRLETFGQEHYTVDHYEDY